MGGRDDPHRAQQFKSRHHFFLFFLGFRFSVFGVVSGCRPVRETRSAHSAPRNTERSHHPPTMDTRKTPVLQGLYTHTPYVSSLAVDRTRYPADKEASWSLDSDLMALRLMHNALRAESTKFEAVLFALGDRKLEPSEVQLIKVRVAQRRTRHRHHDLP